MHLVERRSLSNFQRPFYIILSWPRLTPERMQSFRQLVNYFIVQSCHHVIFNVNLQCTRIHAIATVTVYENGIELNTITALELRRILHLQKMLSAPMSYNFEASHFFCLLNFVLRSHFELEKIQSGYQQEAI